MAGEIYLMGERDYVLVQIVDINSASYEQLKSVKGIGKTYAQRIVEGRPYQNTEALVKKGGIPRYAYERIKDQIVAGLSSGKEEHQRESFSTSPLGRSM
jgi:DNA uptake protein ComE-like DNA-binding protein